MSNLLFRKLIQSIEWNFFTFDELLEKFTEVGEEKHLHKDSDLIEYLEVYLPLQTGYGVFYKNSILKVGTAWCAGIPVLGERLSQHGRLTEDAIISHAVFERPELSEKLSNIFVIDEHEHEHEYE